MNAEALEGEEEERQILGTQGNLQEGGGSGQGHSDLEGATPGGAMGREFPVASRLAHAKVEEKGRPCENDR